MYAKAIEDGKTYRASDMFYNNVKGFHDDGWEEVVEERVFTLEEIENHINEYYTVVTKGCDTIVISIDSTQTPQSSINKLSKYIFSKGRRV